MFAISNEAPCGRSLRLRASRPEARTTPEGVTSARRGVRVLVGAHLRVGRSHRTSAMALGATEASLRARARPANRRRSDYTSRQEQSFVLVYPCVGSKIRRPLNAIRVAHISAAIVRARCTTSSTLRDRSIATRELGPDSFVFSSTLADEH